MLFNCLPQLGAHAVRPSRAVAAEKLGSLRPRIILSPPVGPWTRRRLGAARWWRLVDLRDVKEDAPDSTLALASTANCCIPDSFVTPHARPDRIGQANGRWRRVTLTILYAFVLHRAYIFFSWTDPAAISTVTCNMPARRSRPNRILRYEYPIVLQVELSYEAYFVPFCSQSKGIISIIVV